MRACSGLPELWRSIHQRVGYRRVAQRCRRADQDWRASGDSTIRSGLISFARQVCLAAPSGERPQAACSRARGCPLVSACGPARTTTQQARKARPTSGHERSRTTKRSMGLPGAAVSSTQRSQRWRWQRIAPKYFHVSAPGRPTIWHYLKPVLSLQARILDLSKALLNIEKYAAKSEKAFY